MYIDFDVVEKKDGSVIVAVCEGVENLDYIKAVGKQVTEINIPATVKNIGPWVISDMPCVEHFSVSPRNKHFVEVDGCVYSADMSTLVAYPPSKVCDCFEIPSTVKHIAPGAFRGACQLKCVKIGKNVKVIGYEAFARAYSLEHIYIHQNVETIEYFLQECEDLDLYIMCRESLIIGSAKGSNIDRWCSKNAVRFCPLNEDQVEDFLASPTWNYTVPPMDEDECSQCFMKSL